MADDENDPTAPFNELEAFDSVWKALAWKQLKKRLPIAAKKTLGNRYFFANLVYLCYAIGILLVDYSSLFNGDEEVELSTTTMMMSTTLPIYYCNGTIPVFDCNETTTTTMTTTEIVPTTTTEEIEAAPGYTAYNIMFIVLGFVHLVSATLYWWAWKDHKWNDVIMIPEYLNHIEAALYLWSAFWYTKEDGYFGYYTTRLHIIETTAAFVELFASFGWIMSWYRTYTRTIGRGYTLDDPDTVAYTLTTLSSFVYITYNIEILIHPEDYGTNTRYYTGDVMYFVGAVFYLIANLRDDGWLWWLPVAGQYGLAAGKIQTGKPILTGLPHYPIGGVDPCARCCRRRHSSVVHNDVSVKVLSNGK